MLFDSHVVSTHAAQENVIDNNAWKLSVAQRKSIIMKSIHEGCTPVMQSLRKHFKEYNETLEKYEVSV